MPAVSRFLDDLNALDVEVLHNEPMSRHTSFHIGGPATILLTPRKTAAIPDIISCAAHQQIKLHIIGNGTNLLVADQGINGVVLKTFSAVSRVSVLEDDILEADSGVLLSRTASTAQQHGLTGMEGLHGIPGTVGGGIYMNAGAYGYEIKDVAFETEYCDQSGSVALLRGDAHAFGYRDSFFRRNPGCIILKSRLKLRKGQQEAIRAKMDELLTCRREKQPLEYPSAGSVFKRPPGYFAAKLIDDCGLRGYIIGGAQVSEKHAGFIINRGGATCDDVLRLIEHIQKVVYQRYKVILECEIQRVQG